MVLRIASRYYWKINIKSMKRIFINWVKLQYFKHCAEEVWNMETEDYIDSHAQMIYNQIRVTKHPKYDQQNLDTIGFILRNFSQHFYHRGKIELAERQAMGDSNV